MAFEDLKRLFATAQDIDNPTPRTREMIFLSTIVEGTPYTWFNIIALALGEVLPTGAERLSSYHLTNRGMKESEQTHVPELKRIYDIFWADIGMDKSDPLELKCTVQETTEQFARVLHSYDQPEFIEVPGPGQKRVIALYVKTLHKFQGKFSWKQQML